MIRLYHKDLGRVIEVPEASVPVFKKSGWTTTIPKSHEDQQPSNLPGWQPPKEES
jgi:hypothetical protein